MNKLLDPSAEEDGEAAADDANDGGGDDGGDNDGGDEDEGKADADDDQD